MKFRLFKKFRTVGENEYSLALISNEFYVGVRTLFFTEHRFFGKTFRMKHTQYFHTIKLTHHMLLLLIRFLDWSRTLVEGQSEVESFDIKKASDSIYDALIADIYVQESYYLEKHPQVPEEKVKGFYKQARSEAIHAFMPNINESPILQEFDNYGYRFAFKEYGSTFQDNVYMARSYDDVIRILRFVVLKGTVMDMKQLLLDTDTIAELLEAMTKMDPSTKKGGK